MKNSLSGKLNILKNSVGFSVVELLLALALLLIAIGLGYNLMFFARNSFDRSEERWMEQNEVVSVSGIVYDALNESYYVAIIADKDSVPSDIGFYGMFYIDENGNTIYEYDDGGGSLATAQLPGVNLTLSFEKKIYTINEEPFSYNDLIKITVVSDELKYTVNTEVHLDNMNRDRELHGDDSGPVVVFQTKEIVETIPIDKYDEMCFIATASYGSPNKPSVRLLRRFRDEYLLETGWGAKFVEFYYKNSPPVAAVIEGNSVLRFITRAVLYPVVGLVSLLMNPIHLLSILAGILITLVVYKKKFGFYKQKQLN